MVCFLPNDEHLKAFCTGCNPIVLPSGQHGSPSFLSRGNILCRGQGDALASILCRCSMEFKAFHFIILCLPKAGSSGRRQLTFGMMESCSSQRKDFPIYGCTSPAQRFILVGSPTLRNQTSQDLCSL
ncbi:hypothetical protein CEXT_89181 [Caerostris extrusa]|uniref:Uncharacterized protein n=1 Tax=Caerostris extrusa TaxID=172846 RepID=A0AAV4SXS0_CAEEX|nr:hypothetical protein CEXT_89181 [Caerostris extrusa]